VFCRRREGVCLDILFYRTGLSGNWESAPRGLKATFREDDFTGLGASCYTVWGPRISSGLPTILKLSAQTNSKGLFYWRFARLNMIAVICRLGPCDALRLRSSSRANLREGFIRADFGASGQHHFFPTGTFCFSSSNQFSTTLICVRPAACSTGLSIRKRWPSGDRHLYLRLKRAYFSVLTGREFDKYFCV